jgi:hypothetical protein
VGEAVRPSKPPDRDARRDERVADEGEHDHRDDQPLSYSELSVRRRGDPSRGRIGRLQEGSSLVTTIS